MVKTQATEADVQAFLNAVAHPTRRADGKRLDHLFQEVTGWQPKMWGPTIVGYGRYDYTYDTGHSGSNLAIGFSPRPARLSLYILPGFAKAAPLLERLGKHKLGKACLYINKLADIDEAVLADLIAAGIEDLATRWSVVAS